MPDIRRRKAWLGNAAAATAGAAAERRAADAAAPPASHRKVRGTKSFSCLLSQEPELLELVLDAAAAEQQQQQQHQQQQQGDAKGQFGSLLQEELAVAAADKEGAANSGKAVKNAAAPSEAAVAAAAEAAVAAMSKELRSGAAWLSLLVPFGVHPLDSTDNSQRQQQQRQEQQQEEQQQREEGEDLKAVLAASANQPLGYRLLSVGFKGLSSNGKGAAAALLAQPLFLGPDVRVQQQLLLRLFIRHDGCAVESIKAFECRRRDPDTSTAREARVGAHIRAFAGLQQRQSLKCPLCGCQGTSLNRSAAAATATAVASRGAGAPTTVATPAAANAAVATAAATATSPAAPPSAARTA
ncbi:hypothetical protein Efla_006027 [Eimeria flavescens]